MAKRLTEDELEQSLKRSSNLIRIGSVYKHYKGNEYKVIGIGIYEPTNESCVIYKALYNDNLTFVRPLSVWLETIYLNGLEIGRFSLLK